MSEAQGPDSASFRAWEDAEIAAEKAYEAWCAEWLETVSAIGQWMEATIKTAPQSTPAPYMAFDDILWFVPDGAWTENDMTKEWTVSVIYDHAPSMKAFHYPKKREEV